MADLAYESFDLAERYRTPVLLLTDGVLGQMMEPLRLPEETKTAGFPRSWATDGCTGRQRRIVKTLYLDPRALESHNLHLQAKYEQIAVNEARSDRHQNEEMERIT
jgi:2-oxoglutarate ferredoxin oxidoreductase subunit alpha